jgi:hypothetical protein
LEEVQELLTDSENERKRERQQHERHMQRHKRDKERQIPLPTIVLLDTPESHANLRLLMGSLHRFHNTTIRTVIYGLNLSRHHSSEVLLWDHVDYFNVLRLFMVSDRVRNTAQKSEIITFPPAQLLAPYWVPIIVKHALEHYDRVLYINSTLLFTKPLEASFLRTWYRTGSLLGSFFTQTDENRQIDEEHDDEESFSRSLMSVESNKCNPTTNILQAMTRSSEAYKHYLIPLVACSRRECSEHERQMIMALGETQCRLITQPFFLRYQNLKDLRKDAHNSCYIMMRDDFIFSLNQLPKSHEWGGTSLKASKIFNTTTLSKSKNKPIHIAIGFPSTTKGNKKPTIDNIPLMKTMLPSLLQSIDQNDDRYLYILYMAFDESDAFYSRPEVQRQLERQVMKRAEGYNIQFQMIKCVDSHGWVSFLWNAVFQYAMDDGVDYFYQINDDIRFVTRQWTESFIGMLKNNPLYPNLGVTGPFDKGNLNLFTQAFVSRVHYEIFGYLYPYIFKNWFSDDWLSAVYNPIRSSFKIKKFIHNTQSYGTRYEICEESGMQNLKIALAIGHARVKEWVEEKRRIGHKMLDTEEEQIDKVKDKS